MAWPIEYVFRSGPCLFALCARKPDEKNKSPPGWPNYVPNKSQQQPQKLQQCPHTIGSAVRPVSLVCRCQNGPQPGPLNISPLNTPSATLLALAGGHHPCRRHCASMRFLLRYGLALPWIGNILMKTIQVCSPFSPPVGTSRPRLVLPGVFPFWCARCTWQTHPDCHNCTWCPAHAPLTPHLECCCCRKRLRRRLQLLLFLAPRVCGRRGRIDELGNHS